MAGHQALLDDTAQMSVGGPHQLGVHKLAVLTQFTWDTANNTGRVLEPRVCLSGSGCPRFLCVSLGPQKEKYHSSC